MPVITDRNQGYGPPLVTGKYSPLQNITIDVGNRPLFSALLTNRRNLLTSTNLLPTTLNLVTPGWAGIINSEVGNGPPLVVISSNRARWIRAGIRSAANKLLTLPGQPAFFANASDLCALQLIPGDVVSPPMYIPTRIGAAGPRNVYIVVHISEYKTYKAVLAGTGINIVGWQFRLPLQNRAPRKVSLTGFGASRFAAVEFCKELRIQAAIAHGAAPWNYAWLFDDNVVALGNFAGYVAVENAMIAAPAAVCAGFHGGTQAETQNANSNWALAEIIAHRGGQAAGLPPSVPPGIIQQVSLWNIQYLTNNHLNFGPIYITSAEDISLVNYFNHQAIPYLYYNGIGVHKEITTYDNGGGAKRLDAIKTKMVEWFASAEASSPPGIIPPPPVEVTPVQHGDGGVQTLSRFIDERVLPNSLLAAQAGNTNIRNTAKTQGVEQITSQAIQQGFVTDAARDGTFFINGAANQPVARIDIP